MTDYMSAWDISEKDFPHDGTDADKLAFCVRYATLAPSPYNVQPWYFRVSDKSVSVFIDRRYALPVIDPDDREMTICCAAALFNLRLAIQYFGYAETTELMPDPDNQDLIARVKLGEKKSEPVEESRSDLFKAIPKRHTNRGVYRDKEVSEEILNKLTSAATKEGAWVHVCSDIERKIIVRMVSEADHIQTGNKNFRRELASWVDARRALSGDGMPAKGMSYTDIMSNLSPTIFRRFEADGKQAANDQELEGGAPVIMVLGTNSGGILERLHAGQALMRVLLLAEINGLASSTLNQPCQVPDLRLRLHDELEHHGRAHMILRFGYSSSKADYTPRRNLADVIEFEGRTASASARAVSSDNKKKSIVKRLFSGWKR